MRRCVRGSRSPRLHAWASASPRVLRRFAGVKSVAEQIGRAENGQDPDAPNKSEFEIQLDPAHGLTTAQLEAESARGVR